MWIKSSDRLPERSGDYLVATPVYYSTGRKGHIYSVTHYSEKHKLFCCHDDSNIAERWKETAYDDVEYWMPIPEIEEEYQ